MNYVRWISRAAVHSGYDIWLATSVSCLEDPAYLALQAECDARLRTVIIPENRSKPGALSVSGSTAMHIRYRRLFGECYRRLSWDKRPDYVFVPYLDYCAYAMALFGSPFRDTPWGGLVINPSFHLEKDDAGGLRSRLRRLKETAFLRLLGNKSLRAIFTFDEVLIQHVRQRRPELAKRLRFLPEPAELHGTHTRESARRELRIPVDAIVILVYGVLDYSKGIDALLESTKDERFPDGISILLAGPQKAEAKTMLASPQARTLREAGRLYEVDKFVHGEEEHAVFQAADMVWVGYRKQLISSGVLIQAAMAGLPVIACDEGLVYWLTQRHDLGLIVRVDDPRAVAEAVSKLVRDRGLSAELGRNGRRFSSAHSVDSFSRVFEEELLLNFPPDE